MTGFVSASGARLTARRFAVVLALCVVACAVIAVLAPLVGVADTGRGRAFELLGLGAYGDSPDHAIVAVRLPRVLGALLVGAALGGSGCALQALLRNPLAEPFTLGISSTSSLAAVIAMELGLERALGDLAIGGAAMVGAVVALVVVVRLARIGNQLPPATLLLAGIAISMFCSAASVIIQFTSDFGEGNYILSWMVGGFDTARLVYAKYAALPIGVGLVGLLGSARALDALAAGPEVAASLGVAVARTQLAVFAFASLLVGVAVALAGPIGFVGLIVPHVLRGAIGSDQRLLLPASMFGGAALLVVCDTLARTVLATHLPAGAVTAVLGGPFFLVLLVGQKRRAAMWGRA
ncbi:MAG TPA: iron ABC transporter permease [Kofleriaceae bacterium]|nr:iron ABC transporter permease [Kofleriaceae bacterium]